jgi:hypothetical protein
MKALEGILQSDPVFTALNSDPQKQYECITEAIKSAIQTVQLESKQPLCSTHKHNYFDDKELDGWTTRVRQLPKRIDETRDKKRRSHMRKKRRHLKILIKNAFVNYNNSE